MNESVIPEALSPKRRLRVSDHTKLYDNRKSYSAVYYELSLTASLDPFALYDEYGPLPGTRSTARHTSSVSLAHSFTCDPSLGE